MTRPSSRRAGESLEAVKLARLQRLRQLQEEIDAARAREAAGQDVFAALDYVPTPRQAEFHEATEFDVLLGGSAGGGKTKALISEGIKDCIRYPGIRIGAFRRTYGELKESLLAELANYSYAQALGGVWNGSEFELRFPNKSVIMFRYAETILDATRRQGGQYQLLLFDERTLTPPDVIAFLESRLRSGRADIPVIGIRSGSNPGGPGHLAVKTRYVDATGYGRRIVTDARGRKVRFIPSSVTDNPHLNREYVNDLKALPDKLRKAFLEGDWNSFAGQAFDFRADRHVIAPIVIPESWRRYCGVDWGFAKPYCVLWGAVDEDGRVYIYREHYGPGVGEGEQAQRLAAAEADREVVVARYADDAMWATRGDAKPIADVYADNGVALTPAGKGKGSRVTGWQRVRSYLAEAPACPHHRAMGWETCPLLHVFDVCENLIRTLPAMPHATTGDPEDIDTDAEDHCLVAGTLVRTGRGLVPIEQVSTADVVATRVGFKPVIASGPTGYGRPVLTVTTAAGHSLTGTANHPVFTVGRGFVPLAELRPEEVLLAWPKDANPAAPEEWRSSGTRGSSFADTPTPNAGQTPSTSHQGRRTDRTASAAFIRKFIRRSTARSRMDTTSTTPTTTPATTIPTTSSCCPDPSTCLTTPNPAPPSTWPPCGFLPPNGTALRQAGHGTPNTADRAGRTGNRSHSPASCAAAATRPESRQAVDSAPTAARPSHAGKPASTARSGSVPGADKSSGPTSTARPRPVPDPVVSVVAEPEPADVYNLTVGGQPEYFAGGLLVHNCADALRYMLINLGAGPEFVIFDTATSEVVPAVIGGFGYRPPEYEASPWWEQTSPTDGEGQDHNQQWWP